MTRVDIVQETLLVIICSTVYVFDLHESAMSRYMRMRVP